MFLPIFCRLLMSPLPFHRLPAHPPSLPAGIFCPHLLHRQKKIPNFYCLFMPNHINALAAPHRCSPNFYWTAGKKKCLRTPFRSKKKCAICLFAERTNSSPDCPLPLFQPHCRCCCPPFRSSFSFSPRLWIGPSSLTTPLELEASTAAAAMAPNWSSPSLQQKFE